MAGHGAAAQDLQDPQGSLIATVAVRDVTLASGLTVEYAETGGPGGIPVVLIHAYVESWRYFDDVLRHLPASLHAYAPTQRGHGDSDRASTYVLADFAGDVVGFMDALGIPRAAIVGSSSGGLIAQLVTSSHPERVSALVLVSSPAVLAGKPGVAAMSDVIAALQDPLDAAFVTDFVRSTSPASLSEERLAVLVGESLAVPARVWKETLDGLIRAALPVPLGRISAPTLLISGDDDAFTRGDQEVLRRGIPHARHIVYDGGGHGVHLARPDRVAKDVAGFLTEHAAAGDL